MASTFTTSGLITGMDWSSIIKQLMQIERQPITRINTQVDTLETQKTAIKDIRTQLLTLRNLFQDFRFGSVFSEYNAESSDDDVMTVSVSGANPVIGSYQVEVLQLASATVATGSGTIGEAIDPDAALASSGIAAEILSGTFSINGVTFTVDPETQSLNDVLSAINADPGVGVNATYDSGTDRVTFSNRTAGDTSIIIFGGSDDESNLLDVLGVTGAMQGNGPSGETQVTSAYNLGSVDVSTPLDETRFAGGAITGTYFKVNGVTITYDPATEGISDVLARLNSSDANVTASYDSATDTIRVVSNTLGSRTISFAEGDGNFLTLTNLTSAGQTAGNDSQFKINGASVQTRSTNEVSNAIGGLTLNLLSVGTSTVTVSSNDDAIVEKVQETITAFNDTVDKIRGLVGTDGDLAGDGTIRAIENTLRSTVFNIVGGLGDYKSLTDIGITTGDTFDSEASAHLELDEDVFREALRDDRLNVQSLFSNGSRTGIADQLFDYLDEATRVTGFLNARAKSNGSIDTQIQALNDRIDMIEDRVSKKEERLNKQFAQVEQLAAVYQQQATAISSLSSLYVSI